MMVKRKREILKSKNYVSYMPIVFKEKSLCSL